MISVIEEGIQLFLNIMMNLTIKKLLLEQKKFIEVKNNIVPKESLKQRFN